MSLQFAIDSKAGSSESLVDVTKSVSNFANPSNVKCLYTFLGLYGGFKGQACAKYVASHLHEEFTKSTAFQSRNTLKALEEAFISTDRTFVADAIVKKDPSAASAIVALAEAQADKCTLFIANVGDGRAVLSHRSNPLVLTESHLAMNVEEANRVVEWGGQVFDDKVMGQCHVARAFGFQKLKDLVIPDPYIRERVVQEGDEFVLLATAPFWTALSDNDAVAKASELLTVHNFNLKEVCRALVQEVASKHPENSVSVALILLHPTPQSLAVLENSVVHSPSTKPTLNLSPVSGSTVRRNSGTAATTPRSPAANTSTIGTPRTPNSSAQPVPSPSASLQTQRKAADEQECRKCRGRGERRPYFGVFGHINLCKSCNGSGRMR